MFTVFVRSSLMLVAVFLLNTVATEARPPAAKGQPLRIWTDSSGTHTIRAALVDVADGQVRLKRSDGSVVTVAIDKLSETDQKWLAKQSPSAGAGESAEGEWPGWLGPNRDGKSPDKGLLRQWPSEGPKLLWKAGNIGKGFSGVAVAGGAVYITGDVGGTLMIFAFDMDGKAKWRSTGPDYGADHAGRPATPTIDGGNLYLLSGVGALGCYDAQSGRRKWVQNAVEFGGKPGHWGYAESVLIYEKLAIFKPGGRNCIVALDKATGRPVWTSQGIVAGPEYSSCLAFSQQNVAMIATGTREGYRVRQSPQRRFAVGQ